MHSLFSRLLLFLDSGLLNSPVKRPSKKPSICQDSELEASILSERNSPSFVSPLTVPLYIYRVDYSNAVVGQSQSASARVVQAALEKVAEVQEKIDGKDHDSGGRRWRRRRSSSR